MANVAEVELVAEVTWDWATRLDANQLAMFAWAWNPVFGLDFGYEELGYRPNEDGGRTSMWRLTISGTEAIWVSTLWAWVEAIEGVGGQVSSCSHRDLEWDPEDVRTSVLR